MAQTIKYSPVSIVDYACLTPFGDSVDDLWQACVQGEPVFENGLACISEKWSRVSAEKKSFSDQAPLFAKSLENELLLWSLWKIGEVVARQNLDLTDPRCGLIISTTTGLTKIWEQELMNHLNSQKVEGQVYHPLGSFALELQNQLQHQGPVQVVCSACAAGNQALGLARAWLNSGSLFGFGC